MGKLKSSEVELTLNQALAMLRAPNEGVARSEIFLICGFQPLHLTTFLKAHFAVRFPDRAADVREGLYGDLDGTLANAATSGATAAVVVIEWGDVDSRLSLRSAGGWGRGAEHDIVANCRERWEQILRRLKDVASRMPVVLVPPTLAIPLFGHTAGWQVSAAEAELNRDLAAFLAGAAQISNVRILHLSRLAVLSPDGSRRDANFELAAGFPYTTGHASVVARLAIQLLYPPSPMKGLITDLDDTLWSGIVGEVGVRGVGWSLSDHAQIHGLYQQELRHLSETGVLLGAASKNDPAVVEEALRREDLYIPGSAFFPVKASWRAKSLAVAGILEAWNIGAESVVFVDDSPMELEEVRTAFPSMTCLLFNRRNPAKVLELLGQLRDLFGKPEVQAEDALRQASIRAGAKLKEAAAQSTNGDFIRNLQGRVIFQAAKRGATTRLLELINKTNQFNLNGVRLTDGEWLRNLEDQGGLALGVSYADKFGPLGIIGVMAGRQSGEVIELTSWVLSCRAFSRKIEHQMLHYLFRERGARTVRLCFKPTERNGPLREFLQSIGLESDKAGAMELTEERVSYLKDALPHEVRTLENE